MKGSLGESDSLKEPFTPPRPVVRATLTAADSVRVPLTTRGRFVRDSFTDLGSLKEPFTDDEVSEGHPHGR